MFPLAYVAMSDKKTETYESLFKFINANVFEMKPSAFMTDHEAGLMKALKNCFPGVKMHTCWYHYKV